jgi:hypothetical protein
MKFYNVAALLIIALVLASGCVSETENLSGGTNETPPQIQEDSYVPVISPSDFTSTVDNMYFTLTPRTKFVFEGQTEDGEELNEVYVTGEKKTVMGIETTVVWDRVWLEGELIEDTKDWYAQDIFGNVWYFGEDSVEMLDGKIVSHAGSWEYGVDGALPGIVMEASPAVGDSYRQEYYADEAEDMADVLALDESVSVPFGDFLGCLKTRDWTPLEPGTDEHKYYCPTLGFVVLEVGLEDGEKVELISVEYDAEPSPSSTEGGPEELATNITEEHAREIALQEVSGTVTDVAIERKLGKLTYVVEVMPLGGPETDVIVDMETGEVLAVET